MNDETITPVPAQVHPAEPGEAGIDETGAQAIGQDDVMNWLNQVFGPSAPSLLPYVLVEVTDIQGDDGVVQRIQAGNGILFGETIAVLTLMAAATAAGLTESDMHDLIRQFDERRDAVGKAPLRDRAFTERPDSTPDRHDTEPQRLPD